MIKTILAGASIKVILGLICLLGSCSSKQESSPEQEKTYLSPKYAKGFDVQIREGIKVLIVTRPWLGASRHFTYALLPKNTVLPEQLLVDEVISIPVNQMVVTSTTHIPALDLLGTSDRLIGFPQTQYVSSSAMHSRIEQGLVEDIGSANGINYEALVALAPDLVMTYQSGPDQSELEALRITKIPIVLNADFLEETPLGRAEWIKFMGHLVNKSQSADSIFQIIESEYLLSQNKVQNIKERPTVFSGSLYGGTWYAPGGSSFVAQFIEDAGGTYTWKHQQQSGSLELSLETVVQANSQTDFWIGLGMFTSTKELLTADSRYENFGAFQNSRVYNYHRRISAQGGFEYLELGSARPDIVLKDFVKILHPNVLPNHDLYFFKKLSDE